jgi:two-component system sensor histidine kinase KdpD
MNGRLYLLFVDNPDRFLTKEESLHIHTCEKLCQEFGGEFLRVTSYDITGAIAHVVKEYRITQIIIGESQRSRWKLLLRTSLTQKLMRLLKNIDLHIIASDKKPARSPDS